MENDLCVQNCLLASHNLSALPFLLCLFHFSFLFYFVNGFTCVLCSDFLYEIKSSCILETLGSLLHVLLICFPREKNTNYNLGRQTGQML